MAGTHRQMQRGLNNHVVTAQVPSTLISKSESSSCPEPSKPFRLTQNSTFLLLRKMSPAFLTLIILPRRSYDPGEVAAQGGSLSHTATTAGRAPAGHDRSCWPDPVGQSVHWR